VRQEGAKILEFINKYWDFGQLKITVYNSHCHFEMVEKVLCLEVATVRTIRMLLS